MNPLLDIKENVSRLIMVSKRLDLHDAEIERLERSNGIDLLRLERDELIEVLRLLSSDNREMTIVEGEHGKVKFNKITPKPDTVKPTIVIPILESFVKQRRLAQSKFDNGVTRGQGDKKRIVTIISNAMDENQIKAGFHWIKELGIEKINIDDDIIVDADNKNAFLLKLDKATKNYSNFINSYIAADGSNLGYEKIINTLKSRFF